jgi:predicted ArsR family transcriptional regulator
MEPGVIQYGAKRGVGKTRALVKRWALEGLTKRQIAARVGISTQAVNGHLKSLRASGELPEEGAA